MKVQAKFANGKFGFYGDRRRRDGDIFEIDPKHFSEKWMVKIEDEKRRGRPPKSEQLAESESEEGGE